VSRVGPTSLAALLVASLGLGCGLPETTYFGDVPAVRDPKHLRWCNSGEPESLDPAMASTTTAMPLVYAMFDGLTDHDLNGLPRPSLATHWDISPDLRTYTFHLRQDARWSNGRPLDGYDVAYQALRVLHASFASPNGDNLETVKNAVPFLGGKMRVLMRDTGGLKAGQVVEVVGVGGRPLDDKTAVPSSNKRRAKAPLALRDLGADPSAGYASVAIGGEVDILEITGRPASMPSPAGGAPWAYVYLGRGDGLYGWVPLADLEDQPVASGTITVRPVSNKRTPGLALTPELVAADDAAAAEEKRLADAAKAATEAAKAAGTPAPPPAAPIGVEVSTADVLSLLETVGVRVPDPYTFVFELSDPTPYFISLTPNRALRPTPREVVSRAPRRWWYPGTMVTSGAMVLDDWRERDFVKLKRSDTYWDPTRSKLDRVTAFSMNDQSASANYYFTGGCDATTSGNIPSSYFPVLNGEKTGKAYADYQKAPMLGLYFVYINTEKYNNVHLRRALSHAVDRTDIPRILHGGQIPTVQTSVGQPISTLTDEEAALCKVSKDQPGIAMIMVTGQVCYVPPMGLAFDPDKAKAELALAKAEMGPAFPKTFTYTYNTGTEGHKLIAEFLQQQWQKHLGVTVTLATQEWKTFVADTRAGNYELARFGNISNFPDTEAEFFVNFRCSSPDNRAKWCNPAFEAAMEAVKPIADRNARLVKVAEAERILLDDAPIVPLYVYTQHRLVRPYVKDLAFNPPNQVSLFPASLDPAWQMAGGADK
jgi:ABC-type oligopeptide transport system substrate-binding subunit